MAIQQIFSYGAPGSCIKVASLGAGASSTAQAVGGGCIAINATQDIAVRIGDSEIAAAAATDYRIPANTERIIDLAANTHVRVWNLGSSAADVYIQPLVRN